jgi:hypothetical protein
MTRRLYQGEVVLNNAPMRYNNIVFTLSNIPSQSLETMISSLMAEEKHDIVDEETKEKLLFRRGKSK